MSDQPKMPKSFVQVIFADVGSVIFEAKMDGITPMQLLALAGYFELRAKNELVRMENARIEQEEQQKLSVPKLVVPDEFRR